MEGVLAACKTEQTGLIAQSEPKEKGILFIATLYRNLISFLPWQHVQTQNWWHLTNETYLEFCFWKEAGKLHLYESNTKA
jgi:hypothetical protein